jgi:hypothetical protein
MGNKCLELLGHLGAESDAASMNGMFEFEKLRMKRHSRQQG